MRLAGRRNSKTFYSRTGIEGMEPKKQDMAKVRSIQELQKMRQKLAATSPESGRHTGTVAIKVAMATCSIASGSKDILDFIMDALEKRSIDAKVTKTGCMGYCYAEPTVEVTLPDSKPVIFGYVNRRRADDIIEKYIKNKELIDGIIPQNYESVYNL